MLDDWHASTALLKQTMEAGPDRFQKLSRCPRRRYYTYHRIADLIFWTLRHAGSAAALGDDCSNDIIEKEEEALQRLSKGMQAWASRLRSMLNVGNMGIGGNKEGWSVEYEFLSGWFKQVARQHGAQL
jgi:hypothetical protein